MIKRIVFWLSTGLIFPLGIHAQVTSVDCYVDASVGDASVSSLNTTTSAPSDVELSVFRDYDATNPEVERAYLKFDLSAIPSDAIITRATLKLTPSSVSSPISFGYKVQRVEASWDETTMDWTNQPEGYSVDEVVVGSADASSTSTHEIDVMDHVQNMVHYSFNNHGWYLFLDDETQSNDYGVHFHSSDAASNKPKLEVEYVMPLQVTASITHCTAGNSDGAIDFTISGGTGAYHSFSVKNVEKDLAFAAAQKFGTYSFMLNTTAGSTIDNTTIDISSLDPGVYLVDFIDSAYYDPDDLYDYPQDHFRKYHYFLVGREGEVTCGIIARYGFIDNVKIGDNLGTFVPDDYANTNFFRGSNGALAVNHTGTNTHGSTTSVAYQSASLLNLNLDIPADLEFTSADLNLKGWTRYYQTYTSSNAITISLVTDPWEDHVVTWNSRPGIISLNEINIPQSSTPNGYTPTADPGGDYLVADLLPFIDYWKLQPNYGVDISLASYNYPTRSDRSFKAVNKNVTYFEFCFTVKAPDTTAYVQLKRKLDGGYYLTPVDDILHVKYVEEYIDADGDLNFTIKDKSGLVQTITTPTVENGDNRIDFDVSTLSAGYYILEISNDKNERFYLRFKVV